ncbi:MAG: cobyrinate a,c-diamide synthase [Planctomycetes bacterium]|nr:cobyrinate a,c-diamide synthase [Planctomycetota bacterium]
MADLRLPRVVMGAPGSHSGKTTVTLAILACLKASGRIVAPFKVGPDYIDPQLHARAVDRPSYNLDTYLVPPERVAASFRRASRDAGLAVIEGVMGLFDGAHPGARGGSTAEIAALLRAPVILVVDASGMAGSVAALVQGFRTYDPGIRLAGVVLNRLGGEGHYRHLLPALEGQGVEILGYLPKDAALFIPERQLGLLPASEEDRVTPLLGRLSELARRYLDLDGLLRIAESAPPLEETTDDVRLPVPEKRIRLAWAQDEAFHFTYPENLDLLRAAGAEIVPFSPLRDAELPEGSHGVWIGGGFPELFAAPLSANASLQRSIRRHAESGRAIYAECGGFMYLCEWLEDANGQRHPQVGLIPGGTRMTRTLQQFGYAEATLARDTLLGPAGTVVRGHRFHYSVYVPDRGPIPWAYRVRRASTGEENWEGYSSGRVLATYLHLHLASDTGLAARVVQSCV